MKNILVTGSAGFIGYNLVNKLLNLSYMVTGIDDLSNASTPDIVHKNFKFKKCNIENSEELEKIFSENKIDTIIHLAAKVGVRESVKNPQTYVKTNVLGTLNLLECIKK